jgi:hypothetical protein
MLIGCFGAVVLVFGALFLVNGIVELVQIFRGLNRFLRSDHASVGPVAVLIGLVCIFISVRWIRKAGGDPRK